MASGEPGQTVFDPRRLMPGARMVREWNGVEHAVAVLTEGFEWQGRRFKSLSGAGWNGWNFFGFTPRLRNRK